MALFLIVFLPLLGSLVVGFFGKKLNLMLSHSLSCLMIIIPFFLSLYFLKLTLSENYHLVVPLFEWLSSGDLITEWSLRLDLLTSVMLVVVTSVSSLVHIYSIGYMSHDPHQTRFFAYLSFFTFAMLILQLGGAIVRIPGDGNCGLACLQRLLSLELCVYSIYDIRIMLCDEMEKLGISSVNMRIDGTWINEFMFVAACRLFRVNIIIINSLQNGVQKYGL